VKEYEKSKDKTRGDGISLKEKTIAVAGGAGLSILVVSIMFVVFVYLLSSEPVRNALMPISTDILAVALLIFYGVEVACLFLLPPVITTLLFERKNPPGNSKDLFMMGYASSAITVLGILAMMQALATQGFGGLLEIPSAYVCCPMAFLLWCGLSALTGPAASFIKNRKAKH